MVIPLRKSGFQINPAAVQCAGGTAAHFGLPFAWTLGLAAQFDREACALPRIFVKQRFQLGVFHGFSALFETLLTVFERFDQITDNCVLILHTKVLASRA